MMDYKGYAGMVEFDDEAMYFVPIKRGRRVLAVVEIVPLEPNDDIRLRIAAALLAPDPFGIP